ncbi:hypothetical protein BPMI_02888c [Candidatus Burkholderia pumila]|uniref:Uncharacterized protein n=1 Tax=Candidatus Burkholderia pumila TaxID=1090375 RepID=A0ABR5HL83_9BURK|nr:hypothetical protein BPMI_02888c [Candidatus Burkholderia pumila]
MSSYSKLGATATSAAVTQVDDWISVWGHTDTYEQYPYQVQVRYYLNQFYDRRIPTTSPPTLITPQNHVAFNMSKLGDVFTNIFKKRCLCESEHQRGRIYPGSDGANRL